MADNLQTPTAQAPEKTKGLKLNEDWLAVILAFTLIVLSVLGILGKNGLLITF